jgi:hypothetical protein
MPRGFGAAFSEEAKEGLQAYQAFRRANRGRSKEAISRLWREYKIELAFAREGEGVPERAWPLIASGFPIFSQ